MSRIHVGKKERKVKHITQGPHCNYCCLTEQMSHNTTADAVTPAPPLPARQREQYDRTTRQLPSTPLLAASSH